MINIFISHCSSDEPLAEALVDLLQAALGLSPESIRCTSVDGYRLPSGASVNEQLRLEVVESKSFIGLITPDSIESAYVLFEIGARWGAGLHLIPLLASGATVKDLKGPLSGLNAISCSLDTQLYQLVDDLASHLGVKVRPTASYGKYLKKLIESAVDLPRPVLKVTQKSIVQKFSGPDDRSRKKKWFEKEVLVTVADIGLTPVDLEFSWPIDPDDNVVRVTCIPQRFEERHIKEIIDLADQVGFRVIYDYPY
jgi:hypothetical protein